jgi:hypothetical protein
MGAGTLEESPLGTHHKRKFVVSVRLDLANLSDEVNYSAPSQIARQFAADETSKKVFMVGTNMIIHPKRISPAKERYCSGLLIASCPSTWNAANELPGSVFLSFGFVGRREDCERPSRTHPQSNPAQFHDLNPAMI